MAALVIPGTLVAAAEVIDNPWGVCANAAENAGIELASLLLAKTHGSRPVTLVGSSLGAIVVLSALKEINRRGSNLGLVQDVYLFGAPVSGKSSVWEDLMPLISGKIINCVSSHDTFIKLMLRGLCVETCVAGLEGINHARVMNIDCSGLVQNHGGWVTSSAALLQLVGLSQTYNHLPGYGSVGHRVHVHGVGEGIVRFIGWIDERERIIFENKEFSDDRSRTEWIGIALDKPLAGTTNDGGLKYGRYFDCVEGHGIFVPFHSGRVRYHQASMAKKCYSPSCRASTSSSRTHPVPCCSPVCRSNWKGLVKLSPTPGNTTITADKTAEGSGVWGKGRELKEKKQEEEALKRIQFLSPLAFSRVALRVATCEDFVVHEAVYTLALSSVEGEWLVPVKFSQCQSLHATLKATLGKDGGFPNGSFSNAKKRQNTLESYLQTVIQDVVYMAPDTLGAIEAFFNVVIKTIPTPDAVDSDSEIDTDSEIVTVQN